MRSAILVVPLLALLAACNGEGPEAQPTPTPSPAVARPSPTPEPTPTPTVRPESDFQGTIYFISFDVNAQEYALYSIKPDGTALTKLAILDPEEFHGSVYHFSISPDGTSLAFAHLTEGPPFVTVDSDLSVLDVGIGQVTNITNTPKQATLTNEEVMPAWSPNGKFIAFIARHLPIPSMGPNDYASLEVMAPDGSGRWSLLPEDLLLRTRPKITSFEWSPAGDALLFPEGGHLYLVRSDGSGLQDISGPVLDSDVGGAAWRPDGAAVAVSLRDGLYLLDVSGYQLRGWTQVQSGLRPYDIKWSPDGSRLALNLAEGFAVINDDGSGLKTLPEDFNNASGFAWSPDGDEIAYALIGGPCREGCPPGPLKVTTADGSGARILTEIPVSTILGWRPELGRVTDNLNIRSEPTTDAKIVGKVKKGDRVALIGQVEGQEAEPGSGNRTWYRVIGGYVLSAFVEQKAR
jgi:Tol biopolymer transport system component